MQRLARWDIFLFGALMLFLLAVAATSGMANIQTDAIDYYAIVQRLVGDAPPIVPTLPFVEQRSPGYPLLTLPMYAALGLAPAGETESMLPPDMPPAGQGNSAPSERALLPPQPLRFSEIFFKNFDLAPQGGILRWRILAAMLLTSYALFFGGLLVSARTLATLHPALPGYSLAPLMVVTAPIFMHNLVQTPAYATLAAFGLSCWAAYAWVRAWETDHIPAQAATGLAIGTLVLVRLETVLVAAVIAAGLVLLRRWSFLGWFLAGGLIPLGLLLAYNVTQFGNPFHIGILRGNMSILAVRADHVFAGLVGPRSGLVWYSALLLVGVAGLLVSREARLKILGWGALALIALVLIRLPVMYFCIGQGAQMIDGVLISCPPTIDVMLELVRFDVNRYVIPLAPFSVLGLRSLLTKFFQEKIK
jgi:hypothetical protein